MWAALSFTLGSVGSYAQSTWTGASTAFWNNAGNWTGGLPSTASTVNFTSPSTSSIDVNFTVTTLNVSGGADTINTSGGTLTVSSATNVSTAGAAFNFGLLGAGNLNVYIGGTLTMGAGGASTFSGSTSVYGVGAVLSDSAANAFSPNSVVYEDNLGTVNVNWNETIAALSNYSGAGGSVVLASGATLVMNGGYTSTFSGNISGAGNLEKDTTGTLTLNNANSYTGTTVINGASGTAIQLGDGTTLGSLATSGVSGSGTLSFNEPSAYTFSAPLSGALQVVQAGMGAVTLSGANTYSGGTTVNAGTLKAGSTSAFGGASGSAVTLNGSGTLDLNGFDNTIGSLNGSSALASVFLSSGANLNIITGNNALPFLGVISGTGSLTISPASYQWIGGANTYTGGTTITSGTLLADNASGSATGTGTISIAHLAILQLGNNGDTGGLINGTAAITDNGSVDFSRGDAITFTNNITGSGGVGQFKGGTTTLSGTNTYYGTTEIFYGTLKAGSTSAFGGASGLSPILFSDLGTLDLNGYNNTVGSLSGGATAGNIVSIAGATLTIAGNLSSTSYKGIITGSSGNLALTGSGSVQILDGANTYTGTTTIGTGETLQIGDGVVVGATINPSSSVLDNGALRFSPGLADASAYAGIISGSGTVVVNGANDGTNIGSFNLSNASTYSGGTQVIGGELFVGSSTVGTPGNVLSGPVGKGTLTFANNTEFSPKANVTLANAIAFNGTVDNDDGTSDMTLTGLISGNGTFSWCTWNALNIIGSANTFSGTMDMREGYLYLGSDTALGTGSVTLDTGSSIDAYGSGVTRAIPNGIFINGSSAQIGNGNNNNLTFSGSFGSNHQLTSITIDNGSSGSTTFSGSSSIYGAAFISNNAGTVYANNNSAFGDNGNNVTLSGGSTLNVVGGITIQNPIKFGTGANTLAGSGTLTNGLVALPITNSVIISPSASPGGGPGNLTFTNPLVFVGGAIHFQLYDATWVAGNGWGLISTGGMDFTGATANSITFNVVSVDNTGQSANAIHFNPASSYSWTFATSPTAITGFNASDFNIITSGFTNPMGSGVFYVSEVGNNLNLNFTPVPEPSTWALIGAGVLAAVPFALRRRRQRAA